MVAAEAYAIPQVTLGVDSNTGFGTSPPRQYVQGATYSVQATVTIGSGSISASPGDRWTVELPAGFVPQSVQPTGNPAQIRSLSALPVCMDASYATCTGTAAFASGSVDRVYVFSRRGGALDIDAVPIPTTLTMGQNVDLTITFVAQSPGTGTFRLEQHIANDGAVGNPGAGDAVDEGITHPLVTTISYSAVSPITRGQTSTVTLSAQDSAANPVTSPITLGEIGTRIVGVTPAGETGVLAAASSTQFTYTPGPAPRIDALTVTIGPSGDVTPSTTTSIVVQPGTVTDLTLAPSGARLAIGQTLTYTPTATNAAGGAEVANVTLGVAPSSVASVNGLVVTAVAEGQATVTATQGSLSATASLTVTATAPSGGNEPVVALKSEPASSELIYLFTGEQRTLNVVGLTQTGAEQAVEPEWTLGPGLAFSPARQRTIEAMSAAQTFVEARFGSLPPVRWQVVVEERYLTLRWELSKSIVRQGEPVTATLVATSNAAAAHTAVSIGAVIPAGLRVVGPAPMWSLDVPGGESTQRYPVVLYPAAQNGSWKLTAHASDPLRPDITLATAPPATLQIVADPEFSEALLVGRVYHDKNKNGRSDEDEPGIAKATIGLSAGLFVTTDERGHYHVPALRPGSVAIKLDVNTLPHVAPLTTPVRQVLVLTPGQVFRADFGVDLEEPRPPPLTQDLTRPPRLGGDAYVVPMQGMEVTVPLTSVRNTREVALAGPNGVTGHYRVTVRRFVSGDVETYMVDPPELVRVDYPPPPQSTHFLVALGEGVAGFEPQKMGAQPIYGDGKLAFVYRGRIQGKYLIDAGADTNVLDLPRFFERDTRRIFRNLDPESYYPVYGDASAVVDERAGGQKLYVRVEAGPFSAKYGAFQTALNNAQYGRYDRSLIGVSARFLMDERHKVIVFYARPDTERAHDELYATGSSLYYLSRQGVVEGSEQIFLERRAQRTGLVRERRLLTPGRDYQVDYPSGRILLDNAGSAMGPVGSVLRQSAAEGDETWLLVDYEVVQSIIATGAGNVVGGRVAERLIKGLELGATGAAELRNGPNNYYLVGGDVTVNVWEPLTFRAEYAHSENSLQNRAISLDGGLTYVGLPDAVARGGDAYNARLSLKWLGEGRAEAYGRMRTFNFNDTSNAPGERIIQGGGTVRTPEWGGFSAAVSADDTRRDAQLSVVPGAPGGVRLGRQTAELELRQAIGPVTLLAGGRYAQVSPGFGDGREAVVAGGAVWKVVPRLAVGVVHQQPLYRTGERVFDSLGRDTQVLTRLTLAEAIEIEAAAGYGERGASGRGTVSLPFSQDTKLTAGLLYGGTLVNEAISVGLRRQTGEGSTAYVQNQFNRTEYGRLETQNGGYETKLWGNHMLSATFEAGKRNPGQALDALVERYGAGVGYGYITDRLSFRARLEGRLDSVRVLSTPISAMTAPSQRTFGGFLRADWKALQDLWFAAWVKANRSDPLAGGIPLAEFMEAAAGFAYRPNWVAKPTLLGRYAFTHERLPREHSQYAGAVTQAHIASLSALIDPWRWVGFLAKAAVKVGRIEIPDLGSQRLLSFLAIPRINGHITKIFDLSAEYRICLDQGIGTKHGALFEASALVAEFVRIGLGYNLSMIDDVAIDCSSQRATGVFVRAQAFY